MQCFSSRRAYAASISAIALMSFALAGANDAGCLVKDTQTEVLQQCEPGSSNSYAVLIGAPADVAAEPNDSDQQTLAEPEETIVATSDLSVLEDDSTAASSQLEVSGGRFPLEKCGTDGTKRVLMWVEDAQALNELPQGSPYSSPYLATLAFPDGSTRRIEGKGLVSLKLPCGAGAPTVSVAGDASAARQHGGAATTVAVIDLEQPCLLAGGGLVVGAAVSLGLVAACIENTDCAAAAVALIGAAGATLASGGVVTPIDDSIGKLREALATHWDKPQEARSGEIREWVEETSAATGLPPDEILRAVEQSAYGLAGGQTLAVLEALQTWLEGEAVAEAMPAATRDAAQEFARVAEAVAASLDDVSPATNPALHHVPSDDALHATHLQRYHAAFVKTWTEALMRSDEDASSETIAEVMRDYTTAFSPLLNKLPSASQAPEIGDDVRGLGDAMDRVVPSAHSQLSGGDFAQHLSEIEGSPDCKPKYALWKTLFWQLALAYKHDTVEKFDNYVKQVKKRILLDEFNQPYLLVDADLAAKQGRLPVATSFVEDEVKRHFAGVQSENTRIAVSFVYRLPDGTEAVVDGQTFELQFADGTRVSVAPDGVPDAVLDRIDLQVPEVGKFTLVRGSLVAAEIDAEAYEDYDPTVVDFEWLCEYDLGTAYETSPSLFFEDAGSLQSRWDSEGTPLDLAQVAGLVAGE